jgi:hypothetical protein
MAVRGPDWQWPNGSWEIALDENIHPPRMDPITSLLYSGGENLSKKFN